MGNKKKGFTLVEILVVVSIFSIMVGSILNVVFSWNRSWNISEVQMDVQFQARRAISEMTKELSQTSQSTISIIAAANDQITFQLPNEDYNDEGEFSWGDQIRYSVILGPTGINQLWRTNLTTAQAEILASYVAVVDGVKFTLASNIISMLLTVNKTPRGEVTPVTIQLDSRVSLRNL